MQASSFSFHASIYPTTPHTEEQLLQTPGSTQLSHVPITGWQHRVLKARWTYLIMPRSNKSQLKVLNQKLAHPGSQNYNPFTVSHKWIINYIKTSVFKSCMFLTCTAQGAHSTAKISIIHAAVYAEDKGYPSAKCLCYLCVSKKN